jgi:hypothetical protein
MTVCIAAFAAKSKAIVCIADRALTYPGYGGNSETDSGIAKIVELPGNWCALFSCDMLTFPRRILDRVKETLSAHEKITRQLVEDVAHEAYTFCWRQELEDRILIPVLLTMDDFTKRSNELQPLDSDLVAKLAQQMSDHRQVCSIIFCGFDGETPHIFLANTPCQIELCDWEGFAVVGGGTEAARNHMLWGEYDKEDSLPSVLYDVFSAKVATEVIQGVGYAWDWMLLTPNSKPREMPKKMDDLIDRVFVTHTHSPFGRKLSKSELAPNDWKKTLEEFAAEVLTGKVRTPKKKVQTRPSHKDVPDLVA